MPGEQVRVAGPADAPAIGRLLHDFNAEYGQPSPGADWIAGRFAELIDAGEADVLLVAGQAAAGSAAVPGPPVGLAVMRFRPGLWDRALECYLAELYVAPEHRGGGLGRALMERVIEFSQAKGASVIELGTGEDDTAARRLYESLGFTDREGGGDDGPLSIHYEREL